MMADLLAAALNPNVCSWALSPAAIEIEAQTVRWIARSSGIRRHAAACGDRRLRIIRRGEPGDHPVELAE
jgi:glutamate/tyrosine decarboxylase-like PLP-dependent enzyme